MNIFFLSTCPAEAARFHCDLHVSKMIVETAQILSTARRMFAEREGLRSERDVERLALGYKSAYAGHPSVIWASKHPAHALWLFRLASALGGQHVLRSRNGHSTIPVISQLLRADADANVGNMVSDGLVRLEPEHLYKHFACPPPLAFGVFASHFRREIAASQAGKLSVEQTVEAYRRMYVMKAERWEYEAGRAYVLDSGYLLGKLRTTAQSEAIARRKMRWYGTHDEPEFFSLYRKHNNVA